ncbi:DUF485 domain-containing protein [Streptomyces wedmorensis]
MPPPSPTFIYRRSSVHSGSNPPRPDDARTSYKGFRQAVHAAQRRFLAVNASAVMAAIALFPVTDVLQARVAGHLTFGVLWGFLQCLLLVASAWWYEMRSTRVCDPLEQSLSLTGPPTTTPDHLHEADRQGW